MPTIKLIKRKKPEVTTNRLIFRSMYNTRQWKELRAKKLEQDPSCEFCLREGKRVQATEVGHIVRITANDQSNWHLIYDYEGLISFCKPHHREYQVKRRREAYEKRQGK